MRSAPSPRSASSPGTRHSSIHACARARVRRCGIPSRTGFSRRARRSKNRYTTGVVYSVSTWLTIRPPTIVMPSGRRSSDPVPGPERQRDAAEQRGHGGHHDGTEAQQARLVDRFVRRLALSRSASSAKSIIMMAFFFTMPISRMMPISEITLKSLPRDQQRQDRAHAGGGQRGENRDRVDVALVQHAQHDVHRHQRGQDQHRLVGERVLKRLRPCPGNSPECSPESRSAARPRGSPPPPRPARRRAPG